jgi:hypothetical protein
MSNDQGDFGRSEIARNRRRTKIIVWSILAIVLAGGLFAVWRMLTDGQPWRGVLVIIVGTFFAWRSYRQATSASRN